MHISVEVDDPKLNDTRAHYCSAQGAFVGLRFGSTKYASELYCPWCGVIVPVQESGHNYPRTVRAEKFSGPRCTHGYPDLCAIDLYDSDENARWDLTCEVIREFRAALLARRYGCAPAVLSWVRPCPQCRKDAAMQRAPRLRYELGEIGKALRRELKSAEKAVRALWDDLSWLHEAFLELEEQSRPRNGDPVRMGFVYLIGHDRAVKIGWSERHPAIPGGRLTNLQSASPDDLKLLALIEGPFSLESELHERFGAHRLRGEWFVPHVEILEYFAAKGTPS